MSIVYASTPRAMLLGAKDESIRNIPLEDIVLPCHLPWTPTFAAKGDGLPHMFSSGGAVRYYGADTFDVTSKYQTHQTPYINTFMENANPIMIQRIIPAGAKTSMLRLSVEVIPTELPVYERDDNGNIVYTFNEYEQRVPVTTGTINGHRLVYHSSLSPWAPLSGGLPVDYDPADLFGTATVINAYRNGTVQSTTGEELGNLITLGENSPTSTLYPIMDFLVSSPGGYGNQVGIRWLLPTLRGNNNTSIDSGSMYATRSYLPRIGLYEIDSKDGAVIPTQTINSELFIDVSLKRGVRAERSGLPLSIDDKFIPSYEINNVNLPYIPGPFNKLHVYHDILEELQLTLINGKTYTFGGTSVTIAGEAAHNVEAADWGRFELNSNNQYMLNLLGGFDETGAPYVSIETNKSALFGGVAFTNDTSVLATGGDDGLIKLPTGEMDELANYEIFDNAVRQIMSNFGNGEVKFLNSAKYPISAIWDSGYSIDTKKALLTPIGLRKDIAVVLATHSVADYRTTVTEAGLEKVFSWWGDNDLATETAIAGSLRTFASAYPESEVHGTATCRAIIIGQSGRLINSLYSRRLPLTYEYADKVSRFMGAGSGFWNADRAYDQKGQNIVEKMRDINLSWREENIADQQWANGLTYVEDYDMRRLFFPAIRTVYNNETSVLNSSVTMWALTTIEREAHNSWRDLTGNGKFSPAKFLQESDRILEERLAKRFDGRFIIQVETFYTQADELRGYSWSCNIYLYAPNMKTVGSYTVIARRIEDYQGELTATF